MHRWPPPVYRPSGIQNTFFTTSKKHQKSHTEIRLFELKFAHSLINTLETLQTETLGIDSVVPEEGPLQFSSKSENFFSRYNFHAPGPTFFSQLMRSPTERFLPLLFAAKADKFSGRSNFSVPGFILRR